MPKLILKEKGTDTEKSFDFKREEISIGRSVTSSIILESSNISRDHANIYPEGKDFYITDLGSGNGTRINGMLIPVNEKYILKHNDIICIDKFDLKFQLIDEMLNQSFNDITDSDILEVKLLKKVLRALDKESIPSLEVLNGSAEGKKIFISEDITEITIGRDPTNEFQIEEYVISRKHAKIVRKWGGIIIQDAGSKNGVYVNNRRVSEEFLHDGDRIALGTIVLIFRNPKEISMEELSKQMAHQKKKTPPADVEKVEKQLEEQDEEVSYTGKELPEEEQKELVKQIGKKEYPLPHKAKQRIKFSSMELSMMGLGILVFIFAIIMIVNVIFS